jgi:four helix bundle protein
MDLAVLCYAATKTFPKTEQFGLTAQIRRSAVSVSANIAEGHSRFARREYLQFVRVARGSLERQADK